MKKSKKTESVVHLAPANISVATMEGFEQTFFVLWFWKNPYGNHIQVVDMFSAKVDAELRARHLKTLSEASLVVIAERIA